jgi:hypothetical protein
MMLYSSLLAITENRRRLIILTALTFATLC